MNEGQTHITLLSQDGNFGRIDFHVAAVNRALGSAAEPVGSWTPSDLCR